MFILIDFQIKLVFNAITSCPISRLGVEARVNQCARSSRSSSSLDNRCAAISCVRIVDHAID